MQLLIHYCMWYIEQTIAIAIAIHTNIHTVNNKKYSLRKYCVAKA